MARQGKYLAASEVTLEWWVEWIIASCFYELTNPNRWPEILPLFRDLDRQAALESAGIDLFAVGRVLGHPDHKSTTRYCHLANDTLLAAVEAGAAKMNVPF